MSPPSRHRLLMRAGAMFASALLSISMPGAQTTVEENVNISRLPKNQSEVAIAINPTNTSQLFASSVLSGAGLFAAYSPDGGFSWFSSAGPGDTDPTDFVIGDANDALLTACCDPSVAWDRFGNLFLAYLDLVAPLDIVIAVSLDGGQTFEPLARLGFDADQPTIVTGPGSAGAPGSLWVTYREYAGPAPGIVAHGIAVDGFGAFGTFGPQQFVGSEGHYGDIEIGNNGQVLVAYQIPDSGEGPSSVLVHLDADGLGAGTFGPAVTATVTNVGGFDFIPAQSDRAVDVEADLAYDRSCRSATLGRAYLAYTEETPDESDDTDILVRYSDDDGLTWSAPIRANDDPAGRSQFNPRIVADPETGAVALTWHDARNDAGDLGAGDTDGIPNTDTQFFAAVSLDGGLTFAPNFRVSAGTSNESGSDDPDRPPGAQDLDYGDYIGLTGFDGVFHPAWADNSNSTGDNPDGALSFFDIYTARITVIALPAPVIDSDQDGVDNCSDNCPGVFNPGQQDTDGDLSGDACDPCTDPDGDQFGDPGFPATTCALDNCPDVFNETQLDTDGDSLGDACDLCTDIDGDGYGEPGFPQNTCGVDNCPGHSNPSQTNIDGDPFGDACDPCPLDFLNDIDMDGVCGDLDNCPYLVNTDQTDSDDDGRGDPCDNCPLTANPNQEDANADGSGDACQPSLLITQIQQDGGIDLEVRAVADDPQDEALGGRLTVTGHGVGEAIIPRILSASDCDLGFFPDGDPSRGIGTGVVTGYPVLIDLDRFFRCDDAIPDYEMALGSCEEPDLSFTVRLLLDPALFPSPVCVRRIAAPAEKVVLNVLQFDANNLRVSAVLDETTIVDIAFDAGLPRRSPITGLEPGRSFVLQISVTDGNTAPVSVAREFLYQGESDLVINNPPLAAIAAPNTVECDRPGAGGLTLDGSASSDPDSGSSSTTEIVLYEWVDDPGGPGERFLGSGPILPVALSLGSHTLALRVTDTQGESGTVTADVTIRDTTAPALHCPGPLASHCGGPQGDDVEVLATAGDVCSPGVMTSNDRTTGGADASDRYPLGTTTVRFVADDGSGNNATCQVPVSVARDITPPELDVSMTPSVLWPPNHRLVPVKATIGSTDECGPPSVFLVSLISDETDDAPGIGDGSTVGDIQGVEIGVADDQFLLRAERSGAGEGRTYSAIYQASDAAGNVLIATATAFVPHSVDGLVEPLILSVREDDEGTIASWTPIPGASAYSLVRGNLDALRDQRDSYHLGHLACIAATIFSSDTGGHEDAVDPRLGEGFFYLAEYIDAVPSGVGTESVAKDRFRPDGQTCP